MREREKERDNERKCQHEVALTLVALRSRPLWVTHTLLTLKVEVTAQGTVRQTLQSGVVHPRAVARPPALLANARTVDAPPVSRAGWVRALHYTYCNPGGGGYV